MVQRPLEIPLVGHGGGVGGGGRQRRAPLRPRGLPLGGLVLVVDVVYAAARLDAALPPLGQGGGGKGGGVRGLGSGALRGAGPRFARSAPSGRRGRRSIGIEEPRRRLRSDSIPLA